MASRNPLPPSLGSSLTTAGETWAGKRGQAQGSHSDPTPRPRDLLFPAVAAGDARAREIEPGEEEENIPSL